MLNELEEIEWYNSKKQNLRLLANWDDAIAYCKIINREEKEGK